MGLRFLLMGRLGLILLGLVGGLLVVLGLLGVFGLVSRLVLRLVDRLLVGFL